MRALKYHGGVALADLGTEDLGAVERGMANLRRHLDNIRHVYGVACVVAVNRFPTDTEAEIAKVVELVAAEGVRAFPATHFADGGAGAHDLAKGVLEALDEPSPYTFSYTYEDDLSLTEKVEAIATRLYGAGQVTWDAKARRRLLRVERDGHGGLPVCVAKTQYSFSTDPTSLGAPSGHELHVREVRLSAGAGFVVVVCGDVMTMPGLPATRRPPASTWPTTGPSSACPDGGRQAAAGPAVIAATCAGVEPQHAPIRSTPRSRSARAWSASSSGGASYSNRSPTSCGRPALDWATMRTSPARAPRPARRR